MTPDQNAYESERIAYFERFGLCVEARSALDREGRRIYWLELPGEGAPMVFVHGGGASALIWPSLAAHLHESGRRMIFVDRPGCGLSYPHIYGGGDYRAQAAEFMEDFIAAIDAPQVDLIANSMGGYFSLVHALRAPKTVRRLVLIGAPAGVDKWLPYPLRVLALRPIQWLMTLGKPMDANGLRDLHGHILVAHPERLDEEFLRVGVMPLPGTLESWNSLLRTIVGPTGARACLRIRDEVAALGVPTRFVWGDADVFAPPKSGEDLARRMSSAGVVTVPGAGHLPWLDEPEPCAEALREFLQSAARAAA